MRQFCETNKLTVVLRRNYEAERTTVTIVYDLQSIINTLCKQTEYFDWVLNDLGHDEG